MKKTLLALVLLCPCALNAQEGDPMLKRTGEMVGKAAEKAGKTLEKAAEKTGNAVEKAAQTVIEPITDPKAAFSRWFDFDPRIQSGERTNFNILPLFVSSPERGVGFGVKAAREGLFKKGDLVNAQIIHTAKNKDAYHFKYEFPANRFTFNRLGGEFEAGFENYTQFYYGMGNRARKEDESDFLPELTTVRLPLYYQITPKFSAGLGFNFENWKVTETGKTGILPLELPGLIGKDQSRLYTTSARLRWDSRDSKTNPATGQFFEGEFEYSKKLLGSETDFRRGTLEARTFMPLNRRKNHILGLRLFMDYKAGDVPFYHLPQLGGVFFTRGLIEGRFRDNLSICGNVEYRFQIHQRMHWAFFMDGGNVYRGLMAVTPDRTKFTGGTGMRYYVPPGNLILARVDGGYSTEGFLIYLTFDHPF